MEQNKKIYEQINKYKNTDSFDFKLKSLKMFLRTFS